MSFSVFGQSPEGKCQAVWYQVSAFSTPNDSFPYQVLEGRGGITWPRCLEGNSTNQFWCGQEIFVRPGQKITVVLEPKNCFDGGPRYGLPYKHNPIKVVQGIADQVFYYENNLNTYDMKAIYSFQQNARIEIYDVDMFLNPTTERFFVDVTVLPFENQDTTNIKPRIYQSAGYLYVETGVKNPISFEVFSSMGERIETLEIVESARIDLMNYKKGVYFIKSALNEDLLNAKFVSW